MSARVKKVAKWYDILFYARSKLLVNSMLKVELGNCETVKRKQNLTTNQQSA